MTMQTATESPDVAAYLAAVRDELADLPETDRAELLDDLASHLAEVAEAHDEGDGGDDAPLAVRLGPPAAYASELRAAAGLPPKGASATPGDESVVSRAPSLTAIVRDRVATAWSHPLSRDARRFVADLRPAWWVTRGALVVAVPAWWTIDTFEDFPIPTVLGSSVLGALACVAAAIVSVRIGRAEPGLSTGARAAVRAVEMALVVAALVLVPQIDNRLRAQSFTFVSGGPRYELESRYGPVTNIYPYAADGTPLENVLLFDQDGRPLHSETQQWWPGGCTRNPVHPTAADGVPVPFSYPHEYEPVSPHANCPPVSAPPVPLPTFDGATTTTTPPAADPNPAG